MSLWADVIRNNCWFQGTTILWWPWGSFHQSHLLIITNSVQYCMKVLYSESDRPSGHSSVSSHVCTFSSLQSASMAESDQGVIEYDFRLLFPCWLFNVAWSGVDIGCDWWSWSNTMMDGCRLRKCRKPFTLLIQSSKLSSGSSLSPGWGFCLDNPLGVWCVPGTCTRVKWNIRITRIHLSYLLRGWCLGFLTFL